MVIWIKKEVGKTWEICHENLSTYPLSFSGFFRNGNLCRRRMLRSLPIGLADFLPLHDSGILL